MNGDVLLSLSYSLLVLIIWGIGAARRAIDTRSFARIYAELAVPVIINQREKGLNTSAITARVALSRQFVDFFEQHLPTLIMSSFSINWYGYNAIMARILVRHNGLSNIGIFWSFIT